MNIEKTIEVEMKFADVDMANFRNKLCEIGALKVAAQSQSDEYYSHPARNFRETDEALRIRSNDTNQILTYKGPKAVGIAKIRTEIEAAFPSDQQTNLKKILENLGFRSLATVRKCRESWSLFRNGTKVIIAIDQVEQLGTFVEIEVLAKATDVAAAEELIRQVANSLQLPSPTKSSYLALLLGQRDG